jgi:hypothetical protein
MESQLPIFTCSPLGVPSLDKRLCCASGNTDRLDPFPFSKCPSGWESLTGRRVTGEGTKEKSQVY